MSNILITGASSGIGKQTAIEFASRGYNLSLAARRLDRLEEVKKECFRVNPKVKVLTSQVDVRLPDELNQAVLDHLNTFGSLDIVYANAGYGVMGYAETLNLKDYQRQFQTNLDGVLNTYYASIEALKKSKGCFAITGSVNSYLTSAKASPYTMSKHAIKALAGSLWLEHQKDHVAITLICPGLVESEIHHIDNHGNYVDTKRGKPPKWLVMDTDRAAKVIARAIIKRKRQQIVTFHGKVFVFLIRHFEGFSFFLQQFFKKFIHSRVGSHQKKEQNA